MRETILPRVQRWRSKRQLMAVSFSGRATTTASTSLAERCPVSRISERLLGFFISSFLQSFKARDQKDASALIRVSYGSTLS